MNVVVKSYHEKTVLKTLQLEFCVLENLVMVTKPHKLIIMPIIMTV